MPVLREHPNELVREQYIQTAAGTLGIDHGWFKRGDRPAGAARGATTTSRERRRRSRRRAGAATAARRVDPREEDVLRWAIHDPELVADWLDASLFVDPVARAAFEQLVELGRAARRARRRARATCARCSSGSRSRNRRRTPSRRRCAPDWW